MATQNIYALTDTWNAAGTTFTAVKMNVTDTASASDSLLMDLQVGGSSKFRVSKVGEINLVSGSATVPSLNFSAAGAGIYGRAGNAVSMSNGVVGFFDAQLGGVTIRDTASYNFSNNSDATSSADLRLARDAANTLAQRNSTNAQAFRVYRSFTDASNYSRLSTGWNISTALIRAEGAGTGTNGNIAFGSAALATNATVGYVMIPTCAGAPTGVPADIPTGQVALHYDTANNKIYVYNGGWVSTAALT